MTLDLVVRAPRAIIDRAEVACVVGVQAGRIVLIDSIEAQPESGRVVELGPDEVLLPGLVDTHVHINDPGRSDWEGFATATRAAAAGGVTTLIDMPLNSIPPTCDVDALRQKQAAAMGQTFVDVGFWGGAVPGNLDGLRELYDAGVFGFKCFLVDSGVPEFAPLNSDQLVQAMTSIASFEGLLIVHAEDPGALAHAPQTPGRSYADFLASRPRVAEDRAIAGLIAAATATGCRTHVLHLSSSDALPQLASARRRGLALTVETCPHYLTLTAEDVPDGATQYKCCPPIREAANRDLLWAGLRDGTIDFIVSDHSPSTPDLKRLDVGDFALAWGGVASLQLGLPIVWSEAQRRGIDLASVVAWMSAQPARFAGLARKGRLAEGFDADLCVFAPDESFVVDAPSLNHRNKLTPYADATLSGVVRSAWLRGVQISTGATVHDGPMGSLLRRGAA